MKYIKLSNDTSTGNQANVEICLHFCVLLFLEEGRIGFVKLFRVLMHLHELGIRHTWKHVYIKCLLWVCDFLTHSQNGKERKLLKFETSLHSLLKTWRYTNLNTWCFLFCFFTITHQVCIYVLLIIVKFHLQNFSCMNSYILWFRGLKDKI